jgi:hypothetical protein
MTTILRNVVAILVGLFVGGAVNMGLVHLGTFVIPPPPGVDVSSVESIKASMHLYEAKHFITPFIAHAAGTLVGAIAAYLIAASYRTHLAYLVGAASFAGGVAASMMLPAPTWFIGLDLVFAYFPMAWIGIKLAGRFVNGSGEQAAATPGEA